MALFSLSPLFLSFIASNLFSDNETGLNVAHFLEFLSIVTGCVYLIGALNLRLPDIHEEGLAPPSDGLEQASEPGERTALLPGKPPSDVAPQSTQLTGGSTLDLLRDVNFWLLFASVAAVLGSVNSFLPCIRGRFANISL